MNTKTGTSQGNKSFKNIDNLIELFMSNVRFK